MILGAPFGGVLADRMNRRTLMVILDAASAVTVALALVWFSAAGFSIIAVGVMQVALSLLGIFETPTVESALPQMLRQYGDATLNTSAAIVSQVQQVSALIPSFLGGAAYSFFGIRPMMASPWRHSPARRPSNASSGLVCPNATRRCRRHSTISRPLCGS